ncbi:type I site-specific deoxyribonuclease, HsdR family, partial [mine drainage metagenome]
ENNVRRKILKEHLGDPAYFARMSALLDEIITARKAKALDYEAYLRRIASLVQQVQAGHADDAPEALKRSPALRALYSNLEAHVASPRRVAGGASDLSGRERSGARARPAPRCGHSRAPAR